jgi:putative nucleotide binding protein
MEDFAYILDYLPSGRPDAPASRREPTAYAVGDNQFTLLELIPKAKVGLTIGERVYIGKDVARREKIAKVKGRIEYGSLSTGSHGELPYVLLEIVKAKEPEFVQFFNTARDISIRYHSLELLPGLGKKTSAHILEERKKGDFQSFKQMQERVPNLHAPDKLVAHRIELELSDPHQKYHLFTRPPARDRDDMY